MVKKRISNNYEQIENKQIGENQVKRTQQVIDGLLLSRAKKALL